jgi:hypothetical protein
MHLRATPEAGHVCHKVGKPVATFSAEAIISPLSNFIDMMFSYSPKSALHQDSTTVTR